jgi:hypothetical protein
VLSNHSLYSTTNKSNGFNEIALVENDTTRRLLLRTNTKNNGDILRYIVIGGFRVQGTIAHRGVATIV